MVKRVHSHCLGLNRVLSLLAATFICCAVVQCNSTFLQNSSKASSSSSSSSKNHHQHNYAVKSIQSEDGDVIDCIDMYKQPAFDHPALRNHIVQMKPSDDPTVEKMAANSYTRTSQLWQKSGSCPEGTIPVRRTHKRELNNSKAPIKDYKTKKIGFLDTKNTFLQINHSRAILIAEGFSYLGVKGDIKVYNPYVEFDDEYSTSAVALKSGPYNKFETIQFGWAVNPRVYGDRETRLFVYWTVDASNATGCFDLTCPGFVQTSHEVALGAAIYPISTPRGLPYQITLYIFQDVETGNWWVQYGEYLNIGYYPRILFDALAHRASGAEWGGEVYSSRLGRAPHTRTNMGSGRFPDWSSGSGSVKRIRIRDNSGFLKFPDWVYHYADEYNCYDVFYVGDYIRDPEFYYGGPGKNDMCP